MKKYTGTRIIALMCAVLFTVSMVFTGCSVKKVTKKTDTNANADDSIVLGGGLDEDETTIVVVGEDGKSYAVDDEGNSVVYEPTSTSVIQKPNNNNNTTTTTTRRNVPSVKPVIPVTPSNPTQPSRTSTTAPNNDEVFNRLAAQRRFGFNKAYDKLAGLANFYLDAITAYFEYNGKYWLVEFWKGEYAMATVGCEIGFYYADTNTVNTYLHDNQGPEYILYGSVKDEDAMYASMKLWQYVKEGDTKPVQKINFTRTKAWWIADFDPGLLYKHSDRSSLMMIGTVEFPTKTMANLFMGAMSGKGFKKVADGTITGYNNYEVYSVAEDGKKVTVGWRYYTDNYQVGSSSSSN